MKDTVTLNKTTLLGIGAAFALILVVSGYLLMGRADASREGRYVAPSMDGSAPVRPAGAQPGWELMPGAQTVNGAPAAGQIQRAVPYAGAGRGANLMPAPAPQGGVYGQAPGAAAYPGAGNGSHLMPSAPR